MNAWTGEGHGIRALSGAALPALSFGSWQIFSRMHFDDLVDQLRRTVAAGQGAFDIANYDGATPRGDTIAFTDILFGRALQVAGIAREDVFVQAKVWLIRFPELSLRAQLDVLEQRTQIERFDMINVGMFQMAQGLDLDELLGQIDGLHREGRIGGWSVTGWAPDVFEDAWRRCRANGWVEPRLVQLKYGPARRAVAEGDPWAGVFDRTGALLQTSDTLEGGVLLGKVPERRIGTDMGGVRGRIEQDVPRFAAVAADFGVHPATLGYAFALTHPRTANALTGVRGVAQLEAALAAGELARTRSAELRSAVDFMWADRDAVDVAAWS